VRICGGALHDNAQLWSRDDFVEDDFVCGLLVSFTLSVVYEFTIIEGPSYRRSHSEKRAAQQQHSSKVNHDDSNFVRTE